MSFVWIKARPGVSNLGRDTVLIHTHTHTQQRELCHVKVPWLVLKFCGHTHS